jgi:hypothetical protein
VIPAGEPVDVADVGEQPGTIMPESSSRRLQARKASSPATAYKDRQVLPFQTHIDVG